MSQLALTAVVAVCAYVGYTYVEGSNPIANVILPKGHRRGHVKKNALSDFKPSDPRLASDARAQYNCFKDPANCPSAGWNNMPGRLLHPRGLSSDFFVSSNAM